MTDYFALLEQPRRPWLDAEKLKDAFHARARNAQPDAELNEAYQVLRDPKRRLHHLLALQGEAPSSRSDRVPPDVEQLFPAVADLTGAADALAEKLRAATSKLSRSLWQGEIEEMQKRIAEMIATISSSQDAALVRLQNVPADDSSQLQELYLQFSYLNRWRAQLEEKPLQLSL